MFTTFAIASWVANHLTVTKYHYSPMQKLVNNKLIFCNMLMLKTVDKWRYHLYSKSALFVMKMPLILPVLLKLNDITKLLADFPTTELLEK